MAVEVNTLLEKVHFSKVDDKKNEEFCDRMITKQITLATRLGKIFDDEMLGEIFLMEFIRRVNIAKSLASRLFSEMDREKIIEKFMEVIDEKSQ